MKINSYSLLFLSIFCLPSFSSAQAEPWVFNGNGVVAFDSWAAPSGKQGETSFSIPQLQFGAENQLTDTMFMRAQIEAGETRDDVSGQYSLKLDEFFITKQKNPESTWSISMGLLPHPTLLLYRQYWQRYLPIEDAFYTNNMSYFSPHDLGAKIRAGFASERGQIVLQVMNGEGEEQDETGRYKDTLLLLDFQFNESWSVSLLGSSGHYELVGHSRNMRQRGWAQLRYLSPEPQFFQGFAIEVLQARDSADGAGETLADGVQLVPDTIATSRGGQLRLMGGRGGWGWFAVGSVQDPDVKIGHNTVTAQILGLSCEWEPGLTTSLQHESWRYEPDHSPGIKDKAIFRLLTRMDFD